MKVKIVAAVPVCSVEAWRKNEMYTALVVDLCVITHSLTTWHMGCFEKLLVIQLANKFCMEPEGPSS